MKNYPVYKITYSDINVVQTKFMVPHSLYLSIKAEADLLDPDGKKDLFKKRIKEEFGSGEWFTDESPIGKAIHTGILDCNGYQSPCLLERIS
jgi:hypothetical protein